MRKLILVAFCFAFTFFSTITNCNPVCYDCEDDYTAQSYMFTRPLTQGLAIRQSAWHNIIHERHGNMQAAVQFTVLGQQSIRDPRTAQYFLMRHKNMLTVMGDEALGTSAPEKNRTEKERDIRAEWLNLPKNFSGKFSIDPQQTQVGFIMEYNQMLKKWFDYGFFEYMWVSLHVPVVFVENHMHFKQYDIQNSPTTGDGPHDILEAFNQKEWRYGKIATHKRTKNGIENIRFAFGSNYLSEGSFQLSYYSHWSFPLGGEDPAHYMFDAVLGSNGHIGTGAGVNLQFVLNRPNPDYDLCFYADLEHTFLIRSDMKRTVDLYGKPWSRYMLFVDYSQGPNLLTAASDSPSPTVPGVNVLTQKFTVRPYSMVDGSMGLRLKKWNFELECGYSIWGRSNEKLDKLACPFTGTYGIAGIATAGDLNPVTASQSTVYKQAENDKSGGSNTFVQIKSSDFDLDSGESRSVIDHRFHVALSRIHKGKKIDGTVCLGAFYEVPQYNSGMEMWGAWGKLGASF